MGKALSRETAEIRQAEPIHDMDTGEADTRLCWAYSQLWRGVFDLAAAADLRSGANQMSDEPLETAGQAGEVVLRASYDLIIGESLRIIQRLDLRTGSLRLESREGNNNNNNDDDDDDGEEEDRSSGECTCAAPLLPRPTHTSNRVGRIANILHNVMDHECLLNLVSFLEATLIHAPARLFAEWAHVLFHTTLPLSLTYADVSALYRLNALAMQLAGSANVFAVHSPLRAEVRRYVKDVAVAIERCVCVCVHICFKASPRWTHYSPRWIDSPMSSSAPR
jgi:hypothetical protein